MRPATPIDQLANEYVKTLAGHYPSFATSIGFPGNETEMDDHSPEALARDLSFAKETIAKLKSLPVQDEVDEVTLDAMLQSLNSEVLMHETGLIYRNLDNIASPAQGIRDIFDLTPTDSVLNWEQIAKRLAKVSWSLEGYARTLSIGFESGDAPARRQVEAVIEQVAQIVEGKFFENFVASAKPELSEALKKELSTAAAAASAGYQAFSDYLKRMLPKANKVDAIGAERYAILSEKFLGARVDLDETYQWGIEELARVIAEQQQVANQILPGATIEEAVAHLDKDPNNKLHSTEELKAWMQKLSDQAIEELGKTHFDIAQPIRNLECMIAPTQSGVIYYTGPSDDFSRPGRMWWSVPEGVTEFDTWRETTTVYHEGVPGHHLQIAQATYIRDTLNDWRRLAAWTSGAGRSMPSA